jgi:hypothetical protein
MGDDESTSGALWHPFVVCLVVCKLFRQLAGAILKSI